MKNKITSNFVSLTAVIILATFILGCGKSNKETTEKDTKTTTTQKAPEKTADNKTQSNTSGALSFDVVNNMGLTLVDVYVTPAETDHWGNDILPNHLFENGSTIKISIPADYGTTCMFDMKITDGAGGHVTFKNIDACKLVKLKLNSDGTFEYLATK